MPGTLPKELRADFVAVAQWGDAPIKPVAAEIAGSWPPPLTRCRRQRPGVTVFEPVTLHEAHCRIPVTVTCCVLDAYAETGWRASR